MWTLEATEIYLRRFKWFAKKRKRELKAVLDNLDTYLKALQAGTKPQQKPFGFMHPEPLGVWAIDQKGGGKALAETRLYVYPEDINEVLYQLTLGDKQSQREDLNDCKEYVSDLRKGIVKNDQTQKEPEKRAEEEKPVS